MYVLCLQMDLFVSVPKAGNWKQMAQRMEGRLLLGGESSEPVLVVVPTEAEAKSMPEAVIWLKGGGVGKSG